MAETATFTSEPSEGDREASSSLGTRSAAIGLPVAGDDRLAEPEGSRSFDHGLRHHVFGLGSWALLPVAIWQGAAVRRRIGRMSPPAGIPEGIVGDNGSEPRLRILVMGDSSAAGVGVTRIEDTLGPRLAECLNRQTGETVYWRNAGANSATCEQLRDHVLPHVAPVPFTHVVLTVGTNDMKNFLPRRRFKAGFGGLLYAVHAKWPGATVIWSPIIDMRTVPALPRALGHILEMRVQMLNAIGLALCRDRGAIAAPQLKADDRAGFAEDGFHASAIGYAHWAEVLARVVMDARGR